MKSTKTQQLLYHLYRVFKTKKDPNNTKIIDKNYKTKINFMDLITNDRFEGWGHNEQSYFNEDYLSKKNLSFIDDCLNDRETYNIYFQKKCSTFDYEFKRRLIDILKPPANFEYRPNPHDKLLLYDQKALNNLYIYFKTFCDSLSVGDILYYYLYFYRNKKNHPFVTKGYELSFFDENVLSLYGTRAPSAVCAIITMATSNKVPNVYAYYEYADMLYYGNTQGVTQNYSKALEYYKKAAGFSSNQIVYTTEYFNTTCGHPLAFWSLAFIYYNYKKKGRLENAYIEELEIMSYAERIERAIILSKYAIEYSDCANAYNILGNISYELDKMSRINYNLQSAQYYYEKAACKNYSYAFNNLAKCYAEKIATSPQSPEVSNWLTLYVKNLNKASELNNNYASNTLGRFFMDGILRLKNKENTEQSLNVKEWILSKYTEDYVGKLPIDTIDNYYSKNQSIHNMAILYFKKAYQYVLDENSAWAILNMLLHYPNSFDEGFESNEERNGVLRQIGYLGNNTVNKKIIEKYDSLHPTHVLEIVMHNEILRNMYNKLA